MVLTKKNVNNVLLFLYFSIFLLANIFPNYFFIFSNPVIYLILTGLLFLNNYSDLKTNRKIFLTALFLFLLSILSCLFNNSGIGSFIHFFDFLVGIMLFNKINTSKFIKKFIYLLSALLYIYYFKLSFTVWANQRIGIRDFNSNVVGAVLLYNYIIFLSKINNIKNKFLKFLVFILMSVLTIYGIYQTNCRTALLSIFAYIVMLFFPFISNFVYKHKKIFFNMLIIIGTLFPLLYVYMYKNNINFTISFSSKGLFTGREIIWLYMIDALKNTQLGIIFGLGSNFVTQGGIINNFHNWYFGIIYSYGIIIYLLYFHFVIKNFENIKRKEMIIGLLSMFIVGFFENVAMSSISQLYMFIFIILGRKNLNDS